MRELNRELLERGDVRSSQRRPSTKAFKMFAIHLITFLAGAGALALLLFLLPAPPPSPSSVPVPGSFLFSSPTRALEALCEIPTKRLLEARSGRGYFAALDDAAAALPPALHATTPSAASLSSRENDGRLVFIGDIHGCADDFADLLRKVNFEKGRDTLVLLGDIVSKGPESPRALRMARELGALSVRGSHDDAALAAYDYSQRNNGALPKVSRGDTGGENFDFVKNLTRADAKFLREMPWTLEIPSLSAVAVHAGLVPGVAVNRQNPSDVFTMRGVVEVFDDGGGDGSGGNLVVRGWRWLLRSLFHRGGRGKMGKEKRHVDEGAHGGGEERRAEEGGERKGSKRARRPRYRATAAVGEGMPWAEAWSSFPNQGKHVVFGHDSRKGLQLENWATGIDSGCVTGGELTALVLPPRPTSTSAVTSAATAAAAGGSNKVAGALAEGLWPDRGSALVSVRCRGGQQQQ